jgi:hypothetical protein
MLKLILIKRNVSILYILLFIQYLQINFGTQQFYYTSTNTCNFNLFYFEILYANCGIKIHKTVKKIKLERMHGLHFKNVIAAPTLLYGSENWALNRSERRKTETAGMRF